MSKATRRHRCRLCDGRVTPVLDFGPTAIANDCTPHEDRYPLTVARCDQCGHHQLTHTVAAGRLFPPDYPYQSGTSEAFGRHLDELVRKTTRGSFPWRAELGWILDIASNDGSLLKRYRDEGYAVLGVDPAQQAAEKAREDDIETETEFFTEEYARRLLDEHGPPSLITALNVMAHVDDLRNFVLGVRALMAIDTLFVLEVGYLPSVIANRDLGVFYHEHLSYHDFTSLLKFLRAYDFDVVDAELVDSQGGSLRVACRAKEWREQGWTENEHIAALLAAEEQSPPRLDKLQPDIARQGEALRKAVATSGRVVAYGCPAKATTLLQIMRNHGCRIPEVFYDDNPMKIGKHAPGTSIAIVNSNEFGNADRCVLFSYNFAEEIMARHKQFSGVWVIPRGDIETIGKRPLLKRPSVLAALAVLLLVLMIAVAVWWAR